MPATGRLVRCRFLTFSFLKMRNSHASRADRARYDRLLNRVKSTLKGQPAPPPTPGEKFADLIARRVAELLDDRVIHPKPSTSTPPPAPSPYLDYRQAAAYCGCAVKSLQNARSAGELAPVPGGRGVRFTMKELDNFMNKKSRR